MTHPVPLTRYYLHARTRELVAHTSTHPEVSRLVLGGGEWTEVDREAYETLLRQRRERLSRGDEG